MSKIKSFLLCLFCFVPFFASANYSDIFTTTDRVTGDSATVWTYNTGSDTIIQTRLQSGGVYAPTDTLSDPFVCVGCRSPKVIMDSLGNVAATWLGMDPTTYVMGLYGSFYISGVWSAPVLVSAVEDYIISDVVNLKMDNAGAVEVVWLSYLLDLNVVAVRASYSSTFGTWGTAQTLGD